ncbi:MAG: alpha amylase N-terminal ig-like domain-containing protein [Candidatus Eisenbacteria bacterium]|nr:alpha amylase N-terminal ig-like domain-containing protein [Candidatus Eisenbacteria bacterium]
MSRSRCDSRRPWKSTVALVPVLLACMAACAAATQVTFRYQPVIGGVSSVAVAGDFNGWNVSANPMADPGKTGVYQAVVELPPGRVMYKFVVNGSQWITDESAADFSPDGFGGQNSVLIVTDKPVVAGLGSTVKKVEAPKAGLRRVPFRFKPATPVQSVCLAGAFNDWTVGKTPMTAAGGEYTVTLLLPPGEYPYKFVLDGSQWTQDKAGEDGNVDDGFGGKNSLRRVDDRFAAIEVKQGDGEIFPDGVEHAQGPGEVNNLGGGRVQFTARAHRDDVESVDLEVFGGGAPVVTPMSPVNRDKVFDYYRAEVTVPASGAGYVFRYTDGGRTQYLTRKGFAASDAQERFTFDAAKFPPFTTPDWVKNGVIYQIFPDRFRNGSQANDPDFKEWYYRGKSGAEPKGPIDVEIQEYYHLVKDWSNNAVMTQCPWTKDGRDWMAFYGGDVEGVRQSLDYLKDLGVTVIYFNPLFQGKSTHKYDATDYRAIDPHFGTNGEFRTFVSEAKARGIRIILDIVYNHSGNTHWAFKDAVDNGPKSPYYNWYGFRQWPLPEGWPNVGRSWKPSDYYECWWNFGDLPALKFDLAHSHAEAARFEDTTQVKVNGPLVSHLLDATEYWLKEVDADGVRLDVPNEVPRWFWKMFNQRVKSVKPDAYIVGELWGNATDWVKPGVFDAVMNYAFFRDPVSKFLGMGQGTAAEFDATLATGRLAYPSQAVEAQMNLIDSHDTVRFLTQVNGDVSRLKLAALFSMTYVGAPTIYYGDEVGMTGGKDPDCRRTFPWEWQQDPQRVDLHDYYRSLTRLRHAHAALRTGTFRPVHASGMGYAYVRSGGGEDFLVVLNAGRQPLDIPFDTAAWGGKVTATDELSGKIEAWAGSASIAVPASSGRLYRITK